MSDGRYAMLETPKHFSVGHRSVPEPAEGEVRLRVHDCGVCGSDLKMWAGTHAFLRAPLLLGHEIYGTVEELGSRTNGIQAGSAVVVFPAVGCGTCFHCERNQPQLCADMRFFGGQLPGGLAEHVIVPEDNLIVVPDTVPEQQRVLIEPLGVGVHAVARAQIEPGETAVVLGGGAIGLFTALVARARGLEIVLIGEPSAARRSRAEALGFETFDTDTTPVAEAVTARIRPEGADIVFECVGSERTINAALAATRKGGRTIVVGNAPATVQIDGLALQRGDRSFVGVLMYDKDDLVEGMNLLADGLLSALPDESLVEAFTLDDVGAAFTAAKDGTFDAVRVVVRP